MARTQALRDLGSFDARFRRCAELDFAVRAAFAGSHFISVDAPLVTQYLTPTADKADEVRLRYRLLLVEKHRAYLNEKRCYAGAWCYMHARFHRHGTADGACGTSPRSSSFPGGCHCGGSGDPPCSLVYDRSRMDRVGLIGSTDSCGTPSEANALECWDRDGVLSSRRRDTGGHPIVQPLASAVMIVRDGERFWGGASGSSGTPTAAAAA